MCVHDLCLSAQACVGVQMQAWKRNGIFFVLKSRYSEVIFGVLHKKLTSDNKIPAWQQLSAVSLKIEGGGGVCLSVFALLMASGWRTAGLMFFLFSSLQGVMFVSLIWRWSLEAICILQSFHHCLTEGGKKTTTINLSILAKMIQSASANNDYSKLALFRVLAWLTWFLTSSLIFFKSSSCICIWCRLGPFESWSLIYMQKPQSMQMMLWITETKRFQRQTCTQMVQNTHPRSSWWPCKDDDICLLILNP